MSVAHAGWKATWTLDQQTELVQQLRDSGFPVNSETAAMFTREMKHLIDQGCPFGTETAKMAMWRAGIDVVPEEPEVDEEKEAAPAAGRVQANVDAFIAERAERMTDAELEKEIYRRGGFGQAAGWEETASDADIEKALRLKGMLTGPATYGV